MKSFLGKLLDSMHLEYSKKKNIHSGFITKTYFKKNEEKKRRDDSPNNDINQDEI